MSMVAPLSTEGLFELKAKNSAAFGLVLMKPALTPKFQLLLFALALPYIPTLPPTDRLLRKVFMCEALVLLKL